MLPPHTISSLDESEDRVAIHVVTEGNAPGEKYMLQGYNMMPGEFSYHHPGMQEQSAVIIQAGDKTPLAVSIGRELVM